MMMTVDQHRRANGLLQRALSGLRDVQGMIPHRHVSAACCGKAIDQIQAMRVDLEKSGRVDHPTANVVYLSGAGGIAADAFKNAVAMSGDDIDTC